MRLPAWQTSGSAGILIVQSTEAEGAFSSNSEALSAQQRSILTLLIDAAYYSAQAAIDFSNADELIEHYLESGWRIGLDPSPTFQSLRYSSVTPAQHETGRNPFLHYLFDIVGESTLAQTLAGLGAAEIRELRAHFDVDWYRCNNLDVQIAAHDPFVHYLTSGWRELRDPSPSFSTDAYLRRYSDVRAAGIHPFQHWVFHGIGEGRSSGPISSALDSWESLSASQQAILVQIFSIESYQSQDVDRGLSLAKRVAAGGPDSENATPSFNASRYLAAHPEIRGTGQVPFLHYLFNVVGEDALRDLFVARSPAVVRAICEHFDHAWYLYSYPDVEASGHDALIHYMTIGWEERRDPSQEFSTRIYLLRYPDIVEAGVNPFLHWVGFGKAEGRSGASSASNFRTRQYAPSITALLINSESNPLTRDCVAAVLYQTYDKLDIIVAGAPLSKACRAALETAAPGGAEKVVRYLPDRGEASWGRVLEHMVEQASGDLVWIVQGRAIHDSQFLARLTSSFADGSVQLGFGRRLEPNDADYAVEEDILARRMENWTRHPTTPAAIWFPEQLCSDLLTAEQYSVLWRRRPLGGDVWRRAEDYRHLGLWHLYLHMVSGGQIATVRDALIRVPAASGTAPAGIGEDFHLDVDRLSLEVQSFWGAQDKAHGNLPPTDRLKRHVLIVTHGIFAGGAENLPIQMANALAQRGIIVSMLIFKIDVNPEMRATLDPGVSIYEADWVMEYGCEKFLNDIGCSLIHSHGVIGEMFFFRLCDEALPVPYIATLHGSYEASSSKELPERFIAKIVRNVDLFVYTADKNLAPLLRNEVRPEQLVKMINAMPVDAAPFPRSRAELGIAANAVVFTLVARGIPEKGWSTAVNAFKAIQQRHPDQPMHLCLVGEGEEPERLKPLYADDASISFLGFQLRIHGLYRMTDVAIVPTRFAGESFPLCIIQALQVGVPVIATDVGEIASMLMVDTVAGGIVVEHSRIDEQFDARFTEAMSSLVDAAHRKRLAAGATILGQLYDMGRFTDQYVALYEDVIHRFEASRGTVPPAERNAVAA
jgi:glycosyltransferase involved in cell wall biosynthesis